MPAGAQAADEDLVAAGFPHGVSVAVPMVRASTRASITAMSDIFDNVICGVDDSAAGVLAARIGARVALPDGKLTLVSVASTTESAVATRMARQLGERFGARVRAVAAAGGHTDLDMARRIAVDLEVLPGKPVDELTVLSEFADLVVVGSRGLKGLRALGSVSERVAHEARCPVLVVRGQ
jgi:nucleotide-binding universal stress UspA family protein